jgi:hypothetical protein
VTPISYPKLLPLVGQVLGITVAAEKRKKDYKGEIFHES